MIRYLTRVSSAATHPHGLPVLAVLLVAGTFPLSACLTFTTSASSETSVSSTKDPRAVLKTLTSQEESHADTYVRKAFGSPWADLDGNGCGQRDDVLARDLTDVQKGKDSCTVLAGTLVDPWTGKRVDFTKKQASKVQIDHVVSLAEAWRSGAWNWTDERREQYANDLSVLVATAGNVNSKKSDKDAAQWSPEGAKRSCDYAQHVVNIKRTYGLSVDKAERSALQSDLDGCS